MSSKVTIYEVVGPNEDTDEIDDTMETDVTTCGNMRWYIESNFLRKFKAPHLQKLIVNIGYSRTVCKHQLHHQHLRERGWIRSEWFIELGLGPLAIQLHGLCITDLDSYPILFSSE
ncbi:hypothetical protein AHAS_Ahas13G0259800 [Arachis hypogaea]